MVGAGGKGISSTINRAIPQSTSKPAKTVTTASAGSHKHTVTIENNGAHNHVYGDNNKYGGGTGNRAYGAQNGGGHYDTSSAGSHSHTMTLSDAGSHSHSLSGWDSYNRMYSHSCHYIMKVYHIT